MSFTDGVKNFPRLPNGGSDPIGFLTTVIDPSPPFRMTFNVFLIIAADPLLMFRMTPNGNHMLRLLTHSSQLTANSSQLIAFIFLPYVPISAGETGLLHGSSFGLIPLLFVVQWGWKQSTVSTIVSGIFSCVPFNRYFLIYCKPTVLI